MNDVASIRALPDETAVTQLASELVAALSGRLVIYLRGDLGAGKTTFARAFIRALGYPGRVKSPTYGLLETYDLPGRSVLHLDLYRVEDASELEYLAIGDLFDAGDLLLVEWPDRGAGGLPPADLDLEFDYDEPGRSLKLLPCSGAGRQVLRAMDRVSTEDVSS